MKKTIHFFPGLLLLFILPYITSSQTPYCSIKFTILDAPENENPAGTFAITEKMCEFNYKPVVPSGDYWFGRDTSVLNWNNLSDTMYALLKCKEKTQNSPVIDYSVQHMSWEKIFQYKIVRKNFSGTLDTMTIIFPILVKGFVTYFDIGNILYKPGYYELIKDIEYTASTSGVTLSFPGNYIWNSINFEDRKIKIN
jgi:hypothetical protein